MVILGLLLAAMSCHQATQIELQAGMNEVVYPGRTTNIEDAVAPIKNELNRVLFFDGSTWHIYRTSGPTGDLDTFVNGETYMVNMSAPKTWTVR